jgi:hypothetical protein
MHGVAAVALTIKHDRHAISDDAPLKKMEVATLGAIHEVLTQARTIRDAGLERTFDHLYGSGAVQGHENMIVTNRSAATSE